MDQGNALRNITCFALLFTLALSCKKEEVEEVTPTLEQKLVGEWVSSRFYSYSIDSLSGDTLSDFLVEGPFITFEFQTGGLLISMLTGSAADTGFFWVKSDSVGLATADDSSCAYVERINSSNLDLRIEEKGDSSLTDFTEIDLER